MFKLSDFDYHLPPDLIAQHPVRRRDSSRLLVLDRHQKSIGHRRFRDIITFLKPGDLLVLNDTKVLPARLFGRRQSGGKVEVLLLNSLGGENYQALVKPLGRLKDGELIMFAKGFSCRLVDAKKKIVCVSPPGARAVMQEVGLLPLPPYIKRSPVRDDSIRYQTVFAAQEGSVAAPTAGLHFTQDLLEAIKSKGVGVSFLTLHVNYATFAPVRSDDIGSHRMEPEYFEIPYQTVASIRCAKKNGGRIFSVGTTVCKALEDAGMELFENAGPNAIVKSSRLFIRPPFSFKAVDALITNFHLPRTTLMMLISAFAGRDMILGAYREAVERRYRFYSYGDAMLIL